MHWELSFNNSPLTLLKYRAPPLLYLALFKLSSMSCFAWMLCDVSSCNQAEHPCIPQSPFALNWPIELDIWRIESQTQISSCQKKLIQTGSSKTLIFPPLILCSFSAVWWEKWLLISPAVPSGRCQELQWTVFYSPSSLKSFFWRYFWALWLTRWPWGESGKFVSMCQVQSVWSCWDSLPYKPCPEHFSSPAPTQSQKWET